MRSAALRLTAAAVIASAAAGCGAGELEQATSVAPAREGELTVAIAAAAGADPLGASGRAAQFVLRQVYEPLVSMVDPPYGRAGRRKGLALGIRKAQGGSVWIVRLRTGVRFSDGSSFNASAVAANARRWAEAEPALVPGLITADAPRPDRVRLILESPRDDLPERLAHPRAGIVSPAALRPRRGAVARLAAGAAAGTGPFLLERRSRGRVLLERNPGWWGMPLRLGPALRRVELVREPNPGRRAQLLEAGQVMLADELGAISRRRRAELRRDPLIDLARVEGSLVGFERSLRGIDAGSPGTPLSSVWLTATNQAPPG